MRAWADSLFDAAAWWAARGAVNAVRYQPRQLDLALACGARQPEVSAPVARWVAEARALPVVVKATGLPHAAVRSIAAQAGRWFGPTASAVVRWSAGAVAGAADRAVASTLERPWRARVHPGMLVPHKHVVAVLAADMRGFSDLTRLLHDTQYLADLVSEYLTELTLVVERHRGVVFQYTGDGLLALFLAELSGTRNADMLERLVQEMVPQLHGAFDALYEHWRAEWSVSGRAGAEIGLGSGLSFGRATIGFLGPAGKKQFGVIGEPVNMAAFLCSHANAGTVLIDSASFTRAGVAPPTARIIRLRPKKRHGRIEVLSLRYGATRSPEKSGWLQAARSLT